MTPEAPERALVWARRGALALAAVVVIVILTTFVLRIGFALELEWMEGGVLHQAFRLQRGASIYPPPDRDFVPFLYTPLYPAVLAVLGTALPLDYALGRAVSIICVVAIGQALWRAVGREGKPPAHRAVGVAIFAAGYVFAFRWLDLARPDALYMALTTWGLVLLRESWGDHKKAVIAGLLVALGFWTKQTAATFVIASGIGALIVAPRQLWSYALTIAVVAGGGVLVGNAITDGLLWHYIYELHQAHAFNEERFTTKTWGMFVHAWPFVAALTLLVIVEFMRPWLGERRRLDRQDESRKRLRLQTGRGLLYWGLMAVTGLLVSALGYATQWAEPNAFIPGVVFIALFVAVGMPVGGGKELVALGLAGAQLVFSLIVEPMYQPIQSDGWADGFGRSYAWQDPDRTIPSAGAKRRAEALRTELETSPGEVLALHRPWWSVLAGGAGHVGSMGLNDVTDEQRGEIRRTLAGEVAEGRYAQIWFEGEPPRWLLRSLSGYRVERRLHRDARVRPMSGYMSEAGMVTPYRGDQILMVPVAPRDPPEGGQVVASFEDGTLQGFTIEGAAFGSRPVRGLVGKLPAVGPYGGEYLVSSAGAAGKRKLTGVALSPAFTLPARGYVELLVGTSGRRKGLLVSLVEVGGTRRVELDVPKSRYTLHPVRWEIEPGWGGAQIQLRLEDETPEASLWIDDLWVVAEPS